MKRNLFLLAFLALLACTAGFMMSKSSWIGHIGMHIFYKEYTFLDIWWQGAAAVFGFFVLLFIVHVSLFRALSITGSRLFNIAACLVALGGMYLTYHDFRHDVSHRWMGERFHIGFYLFWLGWVAICITFLFSRKRPLETERKDEVDVMP